MTKSGILLILVIFMLSCGNRNKVPPGILKQDKMQEVLWDVLQANVYSMEFIKPDSLRNKPGTNAALLKEVFAMHGVDKADFYSSLVYYKSKPVLMRVILDSMTNKVNRERVNLNLNLNISPQKAMIAK